MEERTLSTDAELVARIAVNFLRNAFKYSPHDAPVGLEMRRHENGALEVRVWDRGPGIPDGEHEYIFDLYARLERDAGSHLRASSGLGLAFCYAAARAVSGHVRVENNDEGGSTFVLSAPDLRSPGHGPPSDGWPVDGQETTRSS